MTNIVDKVIKLSEKICNGEYPVQKLYTYGIGGFCIPRITFNILTKKEGQVVLHISTSLGATKSVPINKVEECKLMAAFEQVKTYAESLVDNILDDCLKSADVKISNVNELDCNN